MTEARGDLETALAEEAQPQPPTAADTVRESLLVAGRAALGFVPGGGAILTLLDIEKKRHAEQRMAMLESAIDHLERQVRTTVGAADYLKSGEGKEHVQTICEASMRAKGPRHIEALAAAYVSGAGLGVSHDHLVQLLDSTLVQLGQPHIMLLRHAASIQGTADLRTRLNDAIHVGQVAETLQIPPAYVQKLANDLAQAGIFVDTGLNKMGGHWGLLRCAITSFGLELHRYFTAPQAYHDGHIPEPESPIPSGSNV